MNRQGSARTATGENIKMASTGPVVKIGLGQAQELVGDHNIVLCRLEMDRLFCNEHKLDRQC